MAIAYVRVKHKAYISPVFHYVYDYHMTARQ